MRISLLSLICLLGLSFQMPLSAGNTSNFQIDYFGERITFHYNPAVVVHTRVCAKDKCVSEYFEEMESTGMADNLLDQFEQCKDKYQLNDWMYFHLIRQSVEKLYENVKDDRKDMLYTMAASFFMAKSGYEVRLTNALLKALFLYAHSTEHVFGVPYIEQDGKRYYNLTASYHKLNTRGIAFRVNEFIPKEAGKPFSFAMTDMPLLSPKVVHKTITFPVDDVIYTVRLKADSNYVSIMRNQPEMQPMDYVQVPLSPTTTASLIPQLRDIIKGKTQREAVEILISFTRRAFEYKWDWDLYDEDHPMIAEELFFSEYSDHEDRAALFFNLVKELLDLPMIVAAHYNNDLTIGVALDEPVGEAYPFQTRLYTICDPTSPNNSKRLGDYPYGFKEEYIKVIGVYNGYERDSMSAKK